MKAWLVLFGSTLSAQSMPTANLLTEYLLNEGSGTTLNNNYCSNLVPGDCYNMTLSSPAPAWVSTGLDFTANGGHTYASVTGANAISLTTFTAYAVVKWTGTEIQSGYAPIFSSPYANLYMALAGEIFGDPSAGSFNDTFAYGMSTWLHDGLWHVIATSYDATNQNLYLDGVLVRAQAETLSPVSFTQLFISNFNNTAYWPGLIRHIDLYNTAHNAAAVASNTATLASIAAKSGIVTGILPVFVLYEGDSLTDQALMGIHGYGYLSPHAALGQFPQGSNTAVAGSTLTDLTNREASDNALYSSSRNINILSVLIGANDLRSESAATFVAALKTYCQAMQAVGWKILLQTVLPQTTGGFNTTRDSANTMIVADTSFYDYLARTDQDPLIGCDACASNTTYYSDGTHLTQTGQAVLSSYVTRGLDLLLGTAGNGSMRGASATRGAAAIR